MRMVPLNITLPNGFLDEEVRDGFTVTKQVKELWAIEIDLLFQLDKICKKYNLKYFADGGTLLGCIRHNGYIPWDDDIDICMTRSDYAKLCEIAPTELEYPYFFQNERTDPGCVWGHSKLCNSNTTMILDSYKKRNFKFNQGIFIDIFPQDNVPDDEIEQKKFFEKLQKLKKASKVFRGRSHVDFGEKNILKILYSRVVNFLGIKNFSYFKFEKLCQKYNGQKCKYCASISFKPERRIGFKPTISLEKASNRKFEFFEIPCPDNYEWILSDYFGDWHTPIKGASMHGSVFIDTDKSYKEYILR